MSRSPSGPEEPADVRHPARRDRDHRRCFTREAAVQGKPSTSRSRKKPILAGPISSRRRRSRPRRERAGYRRDRSSGHCPVGAIRTDRADRDFHRSRFPFNDIYDDLLRSVLWRRRLRPAAGRDHGTFSGGAIKAIATPTPTLMRYRRRSRPAPIRSPTFWMTRRKCRTRAS